MNNLGRDIESGEVVVIDKKYHKKEFHDLKFRLFIARGGFGMQEATAGRAIYGEYVCDGEECRREGYEISKLETEEWQKRFGKKGEINGKNQSN